MTERPILFSGPMIIRILRGEKTQTRRLLRPQPVRNRDLGGGVPCASLDDWIWQAGKDHELVTSDPSKSDTILSRCRFGAPGDRIWCQETWAVDESLDLIKPSDLAESVDLEYIADGKRRKPHRSFDRGRLRPSIFMPRWASRALLEVTEVRVQQLQDITEEDAIAEGVIPDLGVTARHCFRGLWDHLNADRAAWETNPWVFVIAFRRIDG